ncbi:hypothetical protein CIP107561_02051 [Corynebacterium diphtheriae]|nr:hypothetical protein CIP107561_02051 [Corynebacterium diphtheriae]
MLSHAKSADKKTSVTIRIDIYLQFDAHHRETTRYRQVSDILIIFKQDLPVPCKYTFMQI